MSFSRMQSDGLMVVSGDFTLFTPKTVLSPESIQILTRYMSENLPANTADTQNVIFHGVHEKNSPKEKLSCCFKFIDESKIQPGDIVALCPQGWKHFREIVSYVPAEIHYFDKWISMYIVSFEADNLPKDCTKYEFCYISSGNILGTSKPFTFFSTSESDLSIISEGDYIAVEDPYDPGLVVFKSRGSKSTEDFSKELELSAKFENLHVEEETCSGQNEIQHEELDLSAKLESLHVEEENCSGQKELQHEDNVSRSINSESPAETNEYDETQEREQTKVDNNESHEVNYNPRHFDNILVFETLSQLDRKKNMPSTSTTSSLPQSTSYCSSEEVNNESPKVNDKPEKFDKLAMIETLLKHLQSNMSSASTSTTSSNPQSTSHCSSEVVNNESDEIDDNAEKFDKILETLLKNLQSNVSNTSTSTTSSIPLSTSYFSSKVIPSNSAVTELIHKLCNFPPNSQPKPEETASKNTFGAREVEDDCGYDDGQQLDSTGELNCSVGNSSIKTSILSDPPTNSIQQEPVSPIEKMESTTEIKCVKSVLPSTSSSSLETNNCTCSSRITAFENKELQERIRELRETNAFLKSRVSVLELELRTVNDDKYGILLKCVESYENENSFLKDELKRCAKIENEMESLKFKYEKMIEENSDLRMFVANFAPPFSSGDSKAIVLENNKLKVKCEQLEHKITNLEYAIQEEKAAQGLKSSRSVRQVILNQGHELAFMRSECREISEKLKTLIAMFESMNVKTEDYLTVASSLSELQEKCALVIQRDQVKSKLYETISEDHEEKQKLLAQIESLRKEICDVQKQNLKLKEQLISLRKQSVGKVSLQLFRN